MKHVITFFAIAMAMVCSVYAAQVGEPAARQVADRFFNVQTKRFMSHPGQSELRLAYTAERERFYVFDRGGCNGFVIVAGDDRLPQVLGYGAEGDFSASTLPPAVQYWMNEMNRQIAYLQAHGGVTAHHPAKRETAVGPLLTTRWDQEAPYNNYCPTYGNGIRAVTGCVATATAQVMNYYQWPPVGKGSHSYSCDVDGVTPTELSADFSQSVYHWDLMLDEYDENSSPESCDAVARLMSDVGISMDMGYGSSSGAFEEDASLALHRYFGYTDKYYWLHRDHCSAAEWDQLLVDEISSNRPIMYVGYEFTSGHAFVLDGFDTDGYFHVNWGWGGDYDGYFLVSALAPLSRYDFKYDQRGLFGMVPEPQADDVDDFMTIHGRFYLDSPSARLGTRASLSMECVAEGNVKLDTIGYDEWYGDRYYYGLLPMKLGLYDKNGVERASLLSAVYKYFNSYQYWTNDFYDFELPQTLEDGEYSMKLFCSNNQGLSYDYQMLDYRGKEAYVKVIVAGDTAYFRDCFLYNTYGVESLAVPVGVKVNDSIKVGVTVSYKVDYLPDDALSDGPIGNVYLSLLKDGVEVSSSPMLEVMVPTLEANYYEIPLTAPSEPGSYELALNDESGNHLTDMIDWYYHIGDVIVPVYVLPYCQGLVEDFETMAANNSTSAKDVQGRFTTWSFNKSGVRAPGEDVCNGSHAVLMKKPSTLYTTQPLSHNFFMAQACFFNPTSTLSKYKFEYSLDGGSSWDVAYTIDCLDVVEIPEKNQLVVTWLLNLTSAQPAQFRIAMIGGGTGSTYVDDIALYYIDKLGDVNGDGEINIADINAIIDMILSGHQADNGDVNSDSEVSIADVNAVIDIILK